MSVLIIIIIRYMSTRRRKNYSGTMSLIRYYSEEVEKIAIKDILQNGQILFQMGRATSPIWRLNINLYKSSLHSLRS